MLPFSYHRPRSLGDVFALTSAVGANYRLLAGGTDLTVGLRHGSISAAHVIDLKRVTELSGEIHEAQGEIVLPSNVTMTELLGHPGIRTHFPALIEAAAEVGSRQIRNRATLTGNICNASPAADTVPVLALLDAKVRIIGPLGERSVPVAQFIQGNRKIDLAPGELVAAACIPVPQGPVGMAFARITRRRGVDLATVNLACAVGPDHRLRLAVGAASPRPLLIDDPDGRVARATDTGQRDAAFAHLLSAATPISDVRASAEYRTGMLRTLAARTYQVAMARLNMGGGNV